VSREPREIDVRHLGREQVICCLRVGDVLIDPGPEVSSGAVVAALGGAEPSAILLTHIHLDHAGAAGALVRRWPGVQVYVHERGAPHVLDPSKLVASATRLYGDEMDRLWGEIVPVPEANLHVLRGGEQVHGFEVAYTPGHAQHHVAYFDRESGVAYTGDVAGVRIGGGPVLPPTPPPDIDLDAWAASIATLEAWAPERLALTHYGVHGDAAEHLRALRAALALVGELARRTDTAGFAEAVRGLVRREGGEDLLEAYFAAMPPETLWPGLDRYWSRRAAAPA
jgi:glyoxylase-like metal-dependent hydrolase (beta-lactamase superfamily II)